MFPMVDGSGVLCMHGWGFYVEKYSRSILKPSTNLAEINVSCCKGCSGNEIQYIFHAGTFLIQCFIFIHLLNK